MKEGQKLWTREELLLTINLYAKIPFGKMDHRNKDVQTLAALINRTPGAVAKSATNSAQDSSKPKFIEDITFNNDANTPNTNAAPTADKTTETTANTSDAGTASAASIPNSDCASAMLQNNFQRLLNSVNARKKEEERIALIQNSAKQNCLSTEQAKQLLEKIDTDLGKLSAMKSLFSKITNQSEFLSLESMLTEEDSKAYFKMLTKQ